MQQGLPAPILRRLMRVPHLRRFVQKWGAGVNAQNEWGETLLHFTSTLPQAAILLSHGWLADWESNADYYHSPLYECCDCSNWKVVTEMLRYELSKSCMHECLYAALWSYAPNTGADATILQLIEKLGGITPQSSALFLHYAVMGEATPYIHPAIALGWQVNTQAAAFFEEYPCLNERTRQRLGILQERAGELPCDTWAQGILYLAEDGRLHTHPERAHELHAKLPRKLKKYRRYLRPLPALP